MIASHSRLLTVNERFRIGKLAHVVVCDGAPDVTGMHDIDEYIQVVCAEVFGYSAEKYTSLSYFSHNFFSLLFVWPHCCYNLVPHSWQSSSVEKLQDCNSANSKYFFLKSIVVNQQVLESLVLRLLLSARGFGNP